MSLRINIISATFLALASAGAFSAEMNAGTIHFTGQIIEPSCTIQGDSGTDSTVPLGTYPKSLFTDVGIESTLSPFSVILTGCPISSDGLPAVQLTFNGTTTLTGSNTLLDVSKITTGGEKAATGVGVAVSPVGNDTQFIPMDGSKGHTYIPLSTLASDSIQADFHARYKSFAKTVTAGPADADMTVNILYR